MQSHLILHDANIQFTARTEKSTIIHTLSSSMTPRCKYHIEDNPEYGSSIPYIYNSFETKKMSNLINRMQEQEYDFSKSSFEEDNTVMITPPDTQMSKQKPPKDQASETYILPSERHRSETIMSVIHEEAEQSEIVTSRSIMYTTSKTSHR